jgi:hypothetical protein
VLLELGLLEKLDGLLSVLLVGSLGDYYSLLATEALLRILGARQGRRLTDDTTVRCRHDTDGLCIKSDLITRSIHHSSSIDPNLVVDKSRVL